MLRFFSFSQKTKELSLNNLGTTTLVPTTNLRTLSPANKDTYDAELLQALNAGHLVLIQMYSQIWTQGYLTADFETLLRKLELFKQQFQTHLMIENIKIYTTLEQSLQPDSENLALLRDFRQDAYRISQIVIQFCEKYTIPLMHSSQPEFTQALSTAFRKEYYQVKEILERHLKMKASNLYPLYSSSQR